MAGKKVLVKDKVLTTFVLEVFKHLYKIDSFDALWKYEEESVSKYTNNSKRIKLYDPDTSHRLTGLFIATTRKDIDKRNKGHNRWFTQAFDCRGESLYLSTQWNSKGSYQLTLSSLNHFTRQAYGNNYKIIQCPDGSFEFSFVEYDKGQVDMTTDNSQFNFSIQKVIESILSTGLLYSPNLIKRFVFSLMTKPFVILSGLAGSGKTQLAVAFAKALSQDESQYRIVSVGADWTNREPLLGFPNALNKEEYVAPENGVLQLLINANKAGNENKPYFLILDEMNLSYVERYFADFLSAMESHSDIPLWDKPESSKDTTPKTINLPKNLFIIGTINVDETTYMFSPKVLDRANVIEFKIAEEEMSEFLSVMKPIDMDSIIGKNSAMGGKFVELAASKEISPDDSVKKILLEFFSELKSVNAEFGYRSAMEIFRFIAQANKNDNTTQKMSMEEILDAAIVQKLLPKLHGSRKKLDEPLNKLWLMCMPKNYNKESLIITREEAKKAIFKESADKIARMYNAAQENGFTSFAEA